MSPEQAICILKPYASRKLADIYDDHEDYIYPAIEALVPGFEYPDWSHQRVSAIINHHHRGR